MQLLDLFRKIVKYSYICGPLLGVKIAVAVKKSERDQSHLPSLYALKKAFILRKYRHLFNKYSQENVQEAPRNSPIWICWWQGEEHMTPLIKGCYNRLLDMAPPDHPVTLISKETFRNYIDIPSEILKKVEQKKLTITQFSDILRFSLIRKYGGLWIDATTWVTRPISPEIFHKSFYSCRITDPTIPAWGHVAGGKETPWLLAGYRNSPLFSLCHEIFLAYWKEFRFPFDYALIDYCFITAYEHFPKWREEMDQGADVQNQVFALEPLFNVPFNQENFDKISASTPFLKLSYKMGGRPTTEAGDMTYFGYVCNYQRQFEK